VNSKGATPEVRAFEFELEQIRYGTFNEKWQNHTYACQTHGEDDAAASVASNPCTLCRAFETMEGSASMVFGVANFVDGFFRW